MREKNVVGKWSLSPSDALLESRLLLGRRNPWDPWDAAWVSALSFIGLPGEGVGSSLSSCIGF